MSHTVLLPLSCNTVLCFIYIIMYTDENTISMDSMCCMSNKALRVHGGLEAPYNTRLCLVLYGPLDPTLRALLLIQHSCPCFNYYIISERLSYLLYILLQPLAHVNKLTNVLYVWAHQSFFTFFSLYFIFKMSN